jgi:hypothetical protein
VTKVPPFIRIDSLFGSCAMCELCQLSVVSWSVVSRQGASARLKMTIDNCQMITDN